VRITTLAGATALVLAAAAGAAQAGVLRYCQATPDLNAAQRDTLLRLAELVRHELQRAGASAALVSRSGLDLRRFGERYSHAGISLAASPAVPWSVRQLYYDCDEGRARLFDQGIAGFVLGQHDARVGFVSLVLLPESAAAPLAQAALDDGRALALLAGRYSANAYAYSDLHQNCNQWVAELLALAWGAASGEAPRPRAQAQAWLREQGFEPTVVQVGWPPLRLLRPWVPWVREDDHPEADLQAWRYRVVMPESLERFTRRLQPQAQRLEFCLDDSQRLVVREGWEPLGEGCAPGVGDRMIELAPPASP